jgi:hypothetical protein
VPVRPAANACLLGNPKRLFLTAVCIYFRGGECNEL